jgi:O-succinylbenzoate synthase
MAKAAVATAVLDASLRSDGRSLAGWLGVAGERVEVGAAVGLHDRVDDVAAEAEQRVEEGYRHLKLKVEPGRGPGIVVAVQERLGGAAVLRVDANGAYGPDQLDELYDLDERGLTMLEQPFPADRWDLLSTVASDLRTPLCLDESIRGVPDLDTALALGACDVVNVKPGRVGGIVQAVELQERCEDTGLRAWVGGMLETGVGRTAAVALAALPGFTDPGDTSASDRYWDDDLTEPFVLDDGHLAVRDDPGIARPDESRLTPAPT